MPQKSYEVGQEASIGALKPRCGVSLYAPRLPSRLFTRTIRNIPLKVVLDRSDGMPARCVVNLNDITTAESSDHAANHGSLDGNDPESLSGDPIRFGTWNDRRNFVFQSKKEVTARLKEVVKNTVQDILGKSKSE